MTVRPDHVDLARPIYFSGGKRYSGANASIWQMEGHPGDDICFAPACPAISGGEGDDEEIATRPRAVSSISPCQECMCS